MSIQRPYSFLHRPPSPQDKWFFEIPIELALEIFRRMNHQDLTNIALSCRKGFLVATLIRANQIQELGIEGVQFQDVNSCFFKIWNEALLFGSLIDKIGFSRLKLKEESLQDYRWRKLRKANLREALDLGRSLLKENEKAPWLRDFINKKIERDAVHIPIKYRFLALLLCTKKRSLTAILQQGIDIDFPGGPWKKTAFMCTPSLEQSKLLMEMGANVDAEDEFGETVLTDVVQSVEKKNLVLERRGGQPLLQEEE